MSIHAHPDDQDFTVAGTLAKWARAGCEIVSVIVTSGDAGSNDPSKDAAYKPELARASRGGAASRQQRSRDQADGLSPIPRRRGCALDRAAPGAHATDPPAQARGCGHRRSFGAGSTEMSMSITPITGRLSEAAIYAVFPSAGSRMIFADLLDEGLPPHDVKRLYIHGNDKPDTWVDITGTMEIKIEALKKHFSQGDTHDSEQMLRDWAAGRGQTQGHALCGVLSRDDLAGRRGSARESERSSRLRRAPRCARWPDAAPRHRLQFLWRRVLETIALKFHVRLVGAVAHGPHPARDLVFRHLRRNPE